MVERIKPPDKTVFVCKWIFPCQEAEVENIIEIINIADENKNYDNNDINLIVVDTNDDVKSKENIEAVIENENDYKNESYLMVLDTETEVNDKRKLMAVNMENEDELENKKNIDVDIENENGCNRGNNLMLVNMENEDEIEKHEKMYVDVSGGDVDFTVVPDTEEKELIKTMIYVLIDDIEKEENSKNVIYNIQPPCKCKLKRCDLKIGEERKIIHELLGTR